MEYWEFVDKVKELAPEYAHLPLDELLMTVGTESGYYSKQEMERRLNNVYINRVVHLPDAAGYYEQDGEYWFWMTNERNQLFSQKEEDVTNMVLSFFMSSDSNAKSPYDRNNFGSV